MKLSNRVKLFLAQNLLSKNQDNANHERMAFTRKSPRMADTIVFRHR